MNRLIHDKEKKTYINLLGGGEPLPVVCDQADWPGVLRAASDLCIDFERVCGSAADLLTDLSKPAVPAVCIIAGTLGRNSLVDSLAAKGLLDSAFLRSHPESFIIKTIEAPAAGIEKALLIAGADKRGSIFGIYELSSYLGVSPWYWWLDIAPLKKSGLWADPDCEICQAPGVPYRGIFLNDEAPALTNWIYAKFGEARVSSNPPVPPGIANYGREFYCRIFELLLRLKANYLWPAMWNNAFNEDDPENARLADEYGIVMGTSHQEPMLRSQKEWDRRYKTSLGYWNYTKHADVLESFWKEGLERNKDYESIVTIGLRGADDTPMADGKAAENRVLLEKIVDRQRSIIEEVSGKDAAQTPQLWCLYKETQDYYEDGMRVPDDVTLLWSDDNWGNLRRVPSEDERKRSGGAGIYYHFDYHGDPRSYQWINTSQIAKIWDQMSLARQFKADRVWIVNVGHFKGYEYPVSFFLDYAWNPEAYSADTVQSYTKNWAASLFGSGTAGECADLLEKLSALNAHRKPELLSASTWSQVEYHEADRMLERWESLLEKAEKLFLRIPENAVCCYQQLILFPVQSSCMLARLYDAAGKNNLWASQGRISANKQAELVADYFAVFCDLVRWYNKELAGGKWDHFMDQAVLGYTYWADPPENNIDHLSLKQVLPVSEARMGIAIEGSQACWPESELLCRPQLPGLDSISGGSRYIDLYKRGNDSFSFTAVPSEPWLLVDRHSGTVEDQQRIHISVDWDRLPAGTHDAYVGIDGGKEWIPVYIRCFKPDPAELAGIHGFVESEHSIVVNAVHAKRNSRSSTQSWLPLSNYGLYGAMRTCGSYAAEPQAFLEYALWFFNTGEAELVLELSPVLNYMNGKDICIGVSLDDQACKTLVVLDSAYKLIPPNPDWAKSVIENRRRISTTLTIEQGGCHSIKVWALSPGILLERMHVYTGKSRPSALDPLESVYIAGPKT